MGCQVRSKPSTSSQPSGSAQPSAPAALPVASAATSDALNRALDTFEGCKQLGPTGRAFGSFRRRLIEFEEKNAKTLAAHPSIRARLQELQAAAGVPTRLFPRIPRNTEPFWLSGVAPVRDDSRAGPPKVADVVIIGAGLTGSAVMHLLLNAAREALDPALEAAARSTFAAGAAVLEARIQERGYTDAFGAGLRRAFVAAHAALEEAQAEERLAPLSLAHELDRCTAQGLFESAGVLMLDALGTCEGASGRNGGNRGLTENFEGDYRGLIEERVKLLMKARGDDLQGDVLARAPEAVRERAREEIDFIIRAWDESQAIQGQIITEAGLERACDLKTGGWVKVAEDPEEEAALRRDAELLRSTGIAAQVHEREAVEGNFGFQVPRGGLSTQGATYHPVKYVRGVIQRSLARGGRLLTGTRVLEVETRGPEDHVIRAERDGKRIEIRARRVVAATNAYTRKVFPEFFGIEPYRSQVALFPHVPQVQGNVFVTRRQGDDYSNHPAPSLLIQGGGLDTPVKTFENPPVDPGVHDLLVQYCEEKCGPDRKDRSRVDRRYFAPSAEWTGLMGFTPHHGKLPFVGALRPGVFLSGGYNGYGNTFALYCAKLVVDLVVKGTCDHSALLDPAPFVRPRARL